MGPRGVAGISTHLFFLGQPPTYCDTPLVCTLNKVVRQGDNKLWCHKCLLQKHQDDCKLNVFICGTICKFIKKSII